MFYHHHSMVVHIEDPTEKKICYSYHRGMKYEKRVFINIKVICNEREMMMEIGIYTKLPS